MRVLWMEQAQEALSQANQFILEEYGRKASEAFLLRMYKIGSLLADNPNMGALEPLLEGRSFAYRSIVVNRLNKIVYRVVEDRIEIADVWDTRREPQQQADGVK